MFSRSFAGERPGGGLAAEGAHVLRETRDDGGRAPRLAARAPQDPRLASAAQRALQRGVRADERAHGDAPQGDGRRAPACAPPPRAARPDAERHAPEPRAGERLHEFEYT